jgi:hypothetical protein
MVIVRPDQHIAWRGDRIDDPNALLAKITGATS